MIQSPSSKSPLVVSIVTGGLQRGGATTFLCNLAGEMVRRQIPVQVLSLEKYNPLAADFERAGIPMQIEDESTTILEDRFESILNAMAAARPNVVVGNLGAASFEVLRYVPQGVFRVGVAHSDHPGIYEMVGRYPAHVDLLAAVSKTVKAKLEKMPVFARVSISYLPLGVPMPDYLANRVFNGPLKILYLGRLSREQKRVQVFPEILAALKQSGIPFEWTIAGDGSESEWLKKTMTKVNESGPLHPFQKLIFQGPMDYAEVPRFLPRFDVFLLASDYEGLPLVLLEAMGNGIVPVVSDLPSGIRELVNDETGRRVAPDDLPGYAQAIVWLHEHRAEMSRLSANAREKVLHEYSIAAMTDRWLNAFRTAGPQVDWPRRWNIQAPIHSPGSFRFSKAGRSLRRLKLKLRPSS